MKQEYETIQRIRFNCDEKVLEFQQLMRGDKPRYPDAVIKLLGHRVWKLFFDFQLKALEDYAADYEDPDPSPQNIIPDGPVELDEMAKAAVEAGYIKDPRTKPDAAIKQSYSPRFYLYPEDISGARKGDIWLDSAGIPHFITGPARWIEARGFEPKIEPNVMIRVADDYHHYEEGEFHTFDKRWHEFDLTSEFQIKRFKFL